MKRYLTIFTTVLLAIGCEKELAIETPIPNHSDITSMLYTDALSIGVGEGPVTRALNDDLSWSWADGDAIVGYQDFGSKTLNILDYMGDNQFGTDAFDYSTQEAADFVFIYPASAQSAESDVPYFTAPQNGTWEPLLCGVVENTTLDAIEQVDMHPITAALKLRFFDAAASPINNITNVTLGTTDLDNEFVPYWSADEGEAASINDESGADEGYTTLPCSFAGRSITIGSEYFGDDGQEKYDVIINMPPRSFAADELQVSITTSSGTTITKSLPAISFTAGTCEILNVMVANSDPVATISNGYEFNSDLKEIVGINTDYTNSTVKSIKFVTNSSTTSDHKLATENHVPIYIVMGEADAEGRYDVELHTPVEGYKVLDGSKLFGQFTELVTIDFGDNFDTSEALSMSYMFNGCKALQSLDLSNFNTENVEDMSRMFYECYELRNITFGDNFNTSKVSDMSCMFYECRTLQSLDLSNFNTENVTDMSYMFNCCRTLQSLDVSNFNTVNVVNMSNMFNECKVLQSLNLSNFTIMKVENMARMFCDCYALKNITFGNNFITLHVSNMSYMFNGCKALQSLDLSSFDTKNVEDMTYMFNGCVVMKELHLDDSFVLPNGVFCDDMFTNLGVDNDDQTKIYVTKDLYMAFQRIIDGGSQGSLGSGSYEFVYN